MKWFARIISTLILVLGLVPLLIAQQTATKPASGDAKTTPQNAKPRLDNYGDPLPDGALARLGSIRWSIGDAIMAVALSPDATRFALAGSRGIWFMDAATGKPLRRLEGSPTGARSLAFTPDGKSLVAGDFQQVGVYDLATGKKNPDLLIKSRSYPTTTFSFSDDGRWMTAGSGPYGQRTGPMVWDLRKGTTLGPYPVLGWMQIGATLSPDGKLLAAWGSGPGAGRVDLDRTLQLWDVATVKEVRQIKIESGPVTAAVFSPDSKTLAITGVATLMLVDVETGKELRTLAGRRGVSSVAFSKDGRQIATLSEEGSVQLWDAAGGKRLGQYDAQRYDAQQRDAPGQLAFTPAGTILAWSTQGLTLSIREIPTGKQLTPADGHQDPVAALAFAGDQQTLVSVSRNSTICYWDVPAGRELRRQAAPEPDNERRFGPRRPQGLSLSPDGRHLALASVLGRSTRIVDLKTQKILCDIEVNRTTSPNGLFSPAGEILATDDDRLGQERHGQLRLWNVNTGQELARVKIERMRFGQSDGMAFSPDGKVFAFLQPTDTAARQAAEMRLLHSQDGKEFTKPIPVPSGARGLTFSSDGKTIAVTGTRDLLQAWDVASGKALPPIAAPANMAGGVTGLAFSPDGRTVACAALNYRPGGENDGTILIVEWASGSIRTRLTGSRLPVDRMVFSPDGRLLASSSHEHTILLWDMTGRFAVPTRPRAKELDSLWSELATTDGERAYQAMLHLRAAPAEAVKLLDKNVRPAKVWNQDPTQIQQWLADLDSDQFAVREKAAKALRQAGEPALRALEKAIDGKLSLEKRRRIETIVTKLQGNNLDIDALREQRAVEVLEWLATPEAREALQRLSEGAPGALLSQQARAAVKRLRDGNFQK